MLFCSPIDWYWHPVSDRCVQTVVWVNSVSDSPEEFLFWHSDDEDEGDMEDEEGLGEVWDDEDLGDMEDNGGSADERYDFVENCLF